jgi:hypothetical protein
MGGTAGTSRDITENNLFGGTAGHQDHQQLLYPIVCNCLFVGCVEKCLAG